MPHCRSVSLLGGVCSRQSALMVVCLTLFFYLTLSVPTWAVLFSQKDPAVKSWQEYRCMLMESSREFLGNWPEFASFCQEGQLPFLDCWLTLSQQHLDRLKLIIERNLVYSNRCVKVRCRSAVCCLLATKLQLGMAGLSSTPATSASEAK